MPSNLPPALREALGPNEPATAADIATVGWRYRDRARAMLAAIYATHSGCCHWYGDAGECEVCDAIIPELRKAAVDAK